MNPITKKIPQILKKAERTILFNSYHTQSELLFKKLNILSFYKQKFRPNQHLSNKGIKQTINSRRIVLIGYWRTMQCIMTWLQQRRTGCNSWTKTCRLQSKIRVAIFASFRWEKPWRQNRTPSPFFAIASLSMRHYMQAVLLSHANFIRIFVLTMLPYMKQKIIKLISSNHKFLPANSKLRQIWKILNECFQTEFVNTCCVMPEPKAKLLLIVTHPYSAMIDVCTHCHYSVNETARKQFPTYRGPLEI